MDFVFNVLVALHFVGLALIVGGFFAQLRDPGKTVTRWMWDGALTQVVTGLAMVGMVEGGALGEAAKGYIDNGKIGTKLVIALAVAVLAFMGRRRPAPQPGLWLAVGLLALVNIVVAVFW